MSVSKYEELLKDDWIHYFDEDIELGRLRFDKDGKLKELNRLTKDISWLTTNMIDSPTERMCNVYLDYFSRKLGFIHSHCHECWKVVLKPKTVVQLFKLLELQREMNVPSKCGTEQRPFVKAYYGGYWYTRSLDEGKIMYRKIRELADKHFGKDTEVLLKRACTEFEIQYGPSDKWELLPHQKEWETKFNEVYTRDLKAPYDSPDYLEAYIKRNWIHFAANQKIPDMTYLELTGGKPLATHPEYVTYHHKPLIKIAR